MHHLSAKEIHDTFISHEKSAQDICDYFFTRVHRYDKQLGAFITLTEERARKKAALLDEKRKNKKPLGRLAGVPICIKDNQNVKGVITTCGSKILNNFIAPFDATAVRLLEEEDALIIGKTNLDEFAMGSSTEFSSFFPSRNPWNLQCSPGGSSGGSAAAVSARLCPLGTGSDTGGSIRQPACLSGIVGFKPTYGRVSRFGLVALASSWDQIGSFSTNVYDCALMMEIIGKHCDKDATSLPLPPEKLIETLPEDLKGKKIGIPWHFLETLKKETIDNFKESVKILQDLGAQIEEINLDVLQYALPIYHIVQTAEASTNLARFDGVRFGHRSKEAKSLNEIYYLSRDEGFGPEVKRRIFAGTYVLSAGFIDAYYKKAQKVRKVIIDHINTAFSKCDLIAMPTATSIAFELNSIQDPIEMYLQDIFTVGANLAGLPAISVPSGFSQQMPLGLQLMGPRRQDRSVIHSAYAFEKRLQLKNTIPPLFDKELKS